MLRLAARRLDVRLRSLSWLRSAPMTPMRLMETRGGESTRQRLKMPTFSKAEAKAS